MPEPSPSDLLLHGHGRHQAPIGLAEVRAFGLAFIKTEIGIQVIAVDAAIINSLELIEDFRHEDPFDRIIVATSKERVLPLITQDAAFRDYLRNTVW